MRNRVEYNAKLTRMIFYWISINGLIGIILLASGTVLQTALILVSVVNAFYLASITNKAFKVIIDEDKLLLEIHYLLSLFKTRKVIPLNEVQCSFDYEVRARGGKAKVLKIMYKDRPIVELLPDHNGWGEKSLTQIFEKLNN